MVAEPAATPVTTPEEETVATAASEVVQVPPARVLDKDVVAPAQTVVVPEIVGLALTVIVIEPALQETEPPVAVTATSFTATEGSVPAPSSLFVQLIPTLTLALLSHDAGRVAE